eukprot:TRINITY_DN603_c0_g8_i2.p1 TRINITY_DN603_c0_g8~~TRINITY_DN603_c0_g8_i2.p1  ORF type:complete len:481 (-),score=116.42 TRINITY_DN603_c0_g8_i2:123-1544(-)
MSQVDTQKIIHSVEESWKNVIPVLEKYISIPNQSPSFDPEWETNGFLDQAAQLEVDWVHQQNIKGLSIEIVKLPHRTPLIFIVVERSNSLDDTVLLYGHFDKQPPLTETWAEGLGPYTPVLRDGKLYGRGGADDGYSIFSAVTAIKALQEQNIPHSRYVILIEGSEESGSVDLPSYIEHLRERIGEPSLVVCLDSGAGTYDKFWLTTSLRGLIVGTLRVDILEEGVHSGHGSGIVPSSFRIIRQLLSRIEDEQTGEMKILHTQIPEDQVAQAMACAQEIGSQVIEEFLFAKGAGPVHRDLGQLLLNRTWRPTLSVTGVDGIPKLVDAGNVLRPYTSLKLSVRLPPSTDPIQAADELKTTLEANPPYGAKVVFDIEKRSPGWEAPRLSPWIDETLREASKEYFAKESYGVLGEGGSIPFMGMLGKLFPKAQFIITGVLGPASNAHGPNEFMHIDLSKKLTCAVAHCLAKKAATA